MYSNTYVLLSLVWVLVSETLINANFIWCKFNIEMTRWCYRQSKIVSMSLHVVMMFNVFLLEQFISK